MAEMENGIGMKRVTRYLGKHFSRRVAFGTFDGFKRYLTFIIIIMIMIAMIEELNSRSRA